MNGRPTRTSRIPAVPVSGAGDFRAQGAGDSHVPEQLHTQVPGRGETQVLGRGDGRPFGTPLASDGTRDTGSEPKVRIRPSPEAHVRVSEGEGSHASRSSSGGEDNWTTRERGGGKSSGASGEGIRQRPVESRARRDKVQVGDSRSPGAGTSSVREESSRDAARNQGATSSSDGGDSAEQASSATKAPGPEAATRTQDSPTGTIAGVRSSSRPDAAQRVADIQALEKALDARLPGRVHLDLQDADGAGTRLRLALRGSHLTGSIDLTDPGTGNRMRRRVGELHEALARRGLDASTLGVQGARGLEARGIPEAELSSLLQESVQSISRLMGSQEGSNGDRHGRQGGWKQDPHPGSGRDRQFSQKNRTKEEEQ